MQEATPTQDPHGEKREDEATRQSAKLLERLHDADHLLLRGTRERADVGETGDDAWHLLDGAERGGERARHHYRRDDRRRAEPRLEQFADARPLERAVQLLLPPGRR